MTPEFSTCTYCESVMTPADQAESGYTACCVACSHKIRRHNERTVGAK